MTFDASRPVILLGAGGHAKVVLASLKRLGAILIGSVDRDGTDLGIKRLGGDEAVLAYAPEDVVLVNGVGSLNPDSARRHLYESFTARGYRFASVVDPHAVAADDLRLADGVQVMAGAVIQPGCAIGANSIINTRAGIDHDCVIGDHVHIAPGVTLSGSVRVGNDVHIGTGAVIVQNVRIGTAAFIAAGAVVVSDVAAKAFVKGVPARAAQRGGA